MGSGVARFDRVDRPVFGSGVRREAAGRRVTIVVVVAGVLALHAVLFAVVQWEAPLQRSEPLRPRTIEAVLIAPLPTMTTIPAMPQRNEAHRQTPSANRPIQHAVRSISEAPPSHDAPHTRAQTQERTATPVTAPTDVHAATQAAVPAPPVAVAQQPQPQAAAEPVAETSHRVAHLDCSLMKPDYPAQSLRRAEAGTAVIELETAANGHVVAARVATSSGYARLDEAARNAALESHCQPYAQSGKPAPACADVPFTFNLSE